MIASTYPARQLPPENDYELSDPFAEEEAPVARVVRVPSRPSSRPARRAAPPLMPPTVSVAIVCGAK